MDAVDENLLFSCESLLDHAVTTICTGPRAFNRQIVIPYKEAESSPYFFPLILLQNAGYYLYL